MTQTRVVAGFGRTVLVAFVLAAACGQEQGASSKDESALSTALTFHHEKVCSEARAGFAHCHALKRVYDNVPNNVQPFATPSGYGPTQLRSAYNLPTTGGSGVTVAIVDAYDDPNAESDLATYRSTFGLSACTTANGCFKKVNQTGGSTPPTADSGWAGEIALDIDMVSAACPNCHILLVEANSASNADLATAVDYAAAHANAVSNSYGGSESSSDTSENSHYNHPGVLIAASSGDEGYVVEYPAASPTVLAVGGTKLSTSTNSRGWTEAAWNTSNSEGAGSGCSAYETKPSWQTDSGCTKRTVADVSAVADPATGVAVYDTYGGSGWNVYGGTSVASPLVTSIFALTGHASATAQYVYQNTSFFYDVTTGQTSSSCTSYLCKCQAGYDGPTGIGTPNGTLMAGGGSGGGNDFSISAAAASINQGASGSSAVTTATTSGSAQTVSLSVSGAPSGVTASISPTSVTSGSGATVSITVASTVATGTYNLTVTGTATSGSHTANLALTVTSSGTGGGGGGGGSCTTNTQLLANPGFESGTSGWTATSGVLGNTASGSDVPHSGSYFAWLDGYGSSHTDTLSQTVTIPANACTATFSFWLSINTAETTTSTAYDKLTVTAGTTTLATYSNLNKGGYVQKSFDLSAFKGKSVTLTFKGVEDSSLQTSFLIDDTAVNITQ